MGKSKKYENCIIKVYNDFIKEYSPDNQSLNYELIADKEKQHYLIIITGWDDERFVYSIVFHIDIKEDKIWLMHNGTDILILEKLLEIGVPKDDIVIGFQPRYMREFSGFAVE